MWEVSHRIFLMHFSFTFSNCMNNMKFQNEVVFFFFLCNIKFFPWIILPLLNVGFSNSAAILILQICWKHEFQVVSNTEKNNYYLRSLHLPRCGQQMHLSYWTIVAITSESFHFEQETVNSESFWGLLN